MAHELPTIDVHEHGKTLPTGEQKLNRRLFMQLLVYREHGEPVADALAARLEKDGVSGVVYDDVNDPSSFALLTWSEDPGHFVRKVRTVLRDVVLPHATLRPEFTMMGRTYATGHEPNLPWVLLERPVEMVNKKDARWAVWYPLRRHGSFEKLDPKEQGGILMEHGIIGRAYGAQNLANDVRLACHGIDANDNEFVIGLIGETLHPLSHVVQTMRKTRQTSEFIAHMGPFFVGHVRWRRA